MVVGGLLIAWPSLQFLLQPTVIESGSRIAFGVPVGGLAIAGGMIVLARPSAARAVGVGALVLSALSFVVAFGGFLVGMAATGVGGMLCFTWSPRLRSEFGVPAPIPGQSCARVTRFG